MSDKVRCTALHGHQRADCGPAPRALLERHRGHHPQGEKNDGDKQHANRHVQKSFRTQPDRVYALDPPHKAGSAPRKPPRPRPQASPPLPQWRWGGRSPNSSRCAAPHAGRKSLPHSRSKELNLVTNFDDRVAALLEKHSAAVDRRLALANRGIRPDGLLPGELSDAEMDQLMQLQSDEYDPFGQGREPEFKNAEAVWADAIENYKPTPDHLIGVDARTLSLHDEQPQHGDFLARLGEIAGEIDKAHGVTR